MKNIKAFVAERDAMLNKYNFKEFKQYALEHGTTFSSDEVAQIAFHKCITGSLGVKEEYREQSHQWLISRGYESWK